MQLSWILVAALASVECAVWRGRGRVALSGANGFIEYKCTNGDRIATGNEIAVLTWWQTGLYPSSPPTEHRIPIVAQLDGYLNIRKEGLVRIGDELLTVERRTS